MINYVDLARRLKGRSVKDDALMPYSYQFANPNGRPYHDDWQIPWLPRAIQPQGKIKRMDTTFMLPMPMKLVWSSGPVKSEYVAWQEGYSGGLAPGFVLQERDFGCRYVEVYHPVLPIGQAAVYAVWLDDAWRPCYYTESRSVFGKRLHHNRGLKPDVTLGDFMWNFPEASLTWK